MAVHCDAVERFMHEGATHPFLAVDRDGSRWVVKAHRSGGSDKTLLNELVAGRLASLVGFAWPRVDLVRLSEGALSALRPTIEPLSAWAVGIRYVDGLQGPDEEWYGRLNLGTSEHSEALHGKMVLDNWVMLHDIKSDTLQLDPRGKVVFLDAGHAFEGILWNVGELNWSDTKFMVRSPYLERPGLVAARLRLWLDRLRALAEDDLIRTAEDVPKEWGAPTDYLSRLRELLRGTRKEFVPIAEHWIEYHEQIGRVL